MGIIRWQVGLFINYPVIDYERFGDKDTSIRVGIEEAISNNIEANL